MQLYGRDHRYPLCYSERGSVKDFLKPAAVPSIFYVQPISDDISAGMGIYAAFGGETSYPVESPFRYQALNSSVKVVNLQPTLSWKINPELAVGAGVWLSVGCYGHGTSHKLLVWCCLQML